MNRVLPSSLRAALRTVLATLVALALSIFGISAAMAQGPDNSGTISFSQATAVAINSTGQIFASQGGSNDIQVFNISGDSHTQGTALTGTMGTAWSLTVDNNDRLYAVDNDGGNVAYYDAGSTSPDGHLIGRPLVDQDDNPILDEDGNQVHEQLAMGQINVDAAGNVYVVGGSDVQGDGTALYVWNAPVTDNMEPSSVVTGFNNASAVAVAPNGDIYVGSLGYNDGDDTIQVVRQGTGIIDTSAQITSGLHDISNLQFGPHSLGQNQQLYVAERTSGNSNVGVVKVYNQNSTTPLSSKTLTVSDGIINSIALVPENTAQAEGTVWSANISKGEINRYTPGAVVSPDPASLEFGNQLVGSTDDETITVTNGGPVDLIFGSNTDSIASSSDSSQFSVPSNGCKNVTLHHGTSESCTLTVRFAPTSMGSKQAELHLASNAPDSPEIIPLTGTGIAAMITLSNSTSQQSINFGQQPVVDGPTSPVTVTVKNTGTAPLNVSSITIPTSTDSAQFSLTNASNCTASPIAIDASCTVSVTFDPSSRGNKDATLRIASDAYQPPPDVTLTGKGTSAVFGASETAHTFSDIAVNHSSAPATITIQNTGDADMVMGSSAVTFTAGASQYEITNNNCVSTTVAPSGSCTFDVTFKPTSSGQKDATIQVASASLLEGSDTITLHGNGIPPVPIATLDATSLDFGTMVVGGTAVTKVVTITNTGSSDLAWDATSYDITGSGSSSFSVVTADSDCTGTLAEQASCHLTVKYDAATAATHTATLALHNNAATQGSISLTGIGMRPAGAPAVVSVTAGNTTASLNWSASADQGNSVVTGYVVQYATNPSASWSTAPGACSSAGSRTATSCLASGLANGTTYYFRVAAINSAGTSGFSAASVGVTPAAPPAPPAAPAPSPQFASCSLPGKIKKKGTTVIKKADCRTSAGVLVRYKVSKPGGVKVVTKGKKISVVTKGKKKITIKVTLTAPAASHFLAYSMTKVYKIK